MKRFVHAVAVLIVPGVAFAAEAGSRTHHPPPTASLMPAYVEAAKYWLAPRHHLGRAHARHASLRRTTLQAVGSSAAAR